MEWDGGKYEVEQGVAFAEAARKVPTLKQVVYGTAPCRKWPEAYRVEPPIHYAAKWRIEEIVQQAGLPLTALRKCPYHENFTKLTKAKPRTAAAPAPSAAETAETASGDDGERVSDSSKWWEPGTYYIK